MGFGTLFTDKDHPRSVPIQVVAKANGLELDLVNVDRTKPLTVEHLKSSGLGKIPAFVGEDGFALSECIAIAIYVTSQNEKTTLLGKTKQDYASILKWMSFFNSELIPATAGWFRPLIGKDAYNKKAVDDSAKKVQQVVDVVEEHLLHNTYLVGERLTLADIFAAATSYRNFQYFFDAQWRQAHPNYTRWYETVRNQPIYAAAAPKLDFLDKPVLTNVPPKKPETAKAAKPPAVAKPAPAAAQEEDETPAEPKAKHPCELLPKASFPLDEYKRFYSNNETPEALKYFWEKVPADEYSIWKVQYKYNDELTLVFMSNNLIGGFNNRLEASRKYLFGCASVYGENNDSVIEGAFVIRGEDYLPVFDVAPDYESYEFTKLDRSKSEDREYLEAQWSWEKPVVVNGKEYKHADGKVFK